MEVPANFNKNFQDIIASQENLKNKILEQYEKKEADKIRNINMQEEELEVL